MSIQKLLGCYTCLVLILFVVSQAAWGQDRFELEGGQWAVQPTFASDSPEGRLQEVRRKLAQEQVEEAQELVQKWIDQFPNHPLLVEAFLLHGDALVVQQRYYEALFDYERIARSYAASEQFHEALEREYEIARLFIAGMKRRLWGMRVFPAEAEGVELLVRIQERAPGSSMGHRASLALADYYYDQSEMDLAAEAYDLFMENYPDSDHREWTMLRLIQASLARFKGPEFDPTGLIDAAQRLKAYRHEYPAGAERIGAEALLVRIDESLALKELVTAQWYEHRSEYISAVYLNQRLIQDHPQSDAAREAAVWLADEGFPIQVVGDHAVDEKLGDGER